MLGLTSIWALLQLEPNNEDYAKIAVPRLVAALTNDRPRVRLEAATTLGKLGPQSKSAVAALQKSLKDDHHEVRVESLVALAEIGVDSQPAVSDIIELLREEVMRSARLVRQPWPRFRICAGCFRAAMDGKRP